MTPPLVRVSAVSYLNTVPLIWGMQQGPQKDLVTLRFSIPARCAAEVEDGSVDIGLVPVAEIARQQLEIVSDVGIACRGAVRSILLCSKKPIRDIRTLAADSSSRTSVQLAKVILRERYGVTPQIEQAAPDLEHMLQAADAALLIGDPALSIDPAQTPYETLDLGAEWFALTKLPMVFAAWAGKPGLPVPAIRQLTAASYRYGQQHLAEAISREFGRRGITRDLAYEYLTRYIRFEIGVDEQRGLQAFWEMAGLAPAIVLGER